MQKSWEITNRMLYDESDIDIENAIKARLGNIVYKELQEHGACMFVKRLGPEYKEVDAGFPHVRYRLKMATADEYHDIDKIKDEVIERWDILTPVKKATECK